MQSVKDGGPWDLHWRTELDKAKAEGREPGACKTLDAGELWDKVAYTAWACADPGVQFDTTINEWHTCPEAGRINGSNPCSEYMFLDDYLFRLFLLIDVVELNQICLNFL